ncbi:Protein kinase domain-containing protein [Mycena sanguinolenta]|uniref:Protein kinase domain-containing protein n=1 Tax=Mycena sanguinolenta TaxID=230812 RepID=A0A8H6XRC6_9AGAR|nr:Protein kinase domain-containing protein [Mycena sanguinolenta]
MSREPNVPGASNADEAAWREFKSPTEYGLYAYLRQASVTWEQLPPRPKNPSPRRGHRRYIASFRHSSPLTSVPIRRACSRSATPHSPHSLHRHLLPFFPTSEAGSELSTDEEIISTSSTSTQLPLSDLGYREADSLFLSENNITADASAIIGWLNGLFRDRASYDKFLACRGAAAQRFLDLLQDLLDYESSSINKRRLFAALKRLSRTSGLHPQCFPLRDLELGEHVAGGSFSDVYKASLRGQSVAAKVVRAFNKLEVEAAVQNFGQEAVIWRQLSHPNLLPFFGLYYLDRRLCLATSIVGFPSQISDVALGVKHLHEKDVVHGDLKTANVLVTSSFRACITDFGLSSIVNGMSSIQLTNSSMRSRGGTLRYQAPELLIRGHHNSQSDVFAFACVAYELLTGNLPFHESRWEGAVIAALLAGSRPSPTVDCARHPALWNLIQDCWQEQPEMRPPAPHIVKRLRIPESQASIALAGSTADWDDTLTSRFRRSLHPERSFPTVAELESMIFGGRIN